MAPSEGRRLTDHADDYMGGWTPKSSDITLKPGALIIWKLHLKVDLQFLFDFIYFKGI